MKQESISPRARTYLWQRTITRDVKRLTVRLDKFNGSADKIIEAAATLQELKILIPQLREVTTQLTPEVLQTVVELATRQRQDDDWWSGTRQRLNPFKPIGAAIWLVLSGIIIWVSGSLLVPTVQHILEKGGK